jgi:hypothetical protein
MSKTGIVRNLFAFAVVGLTLGGCSTPTEDEAANSTESAIGNNDGVSVSAGAAAPEAAVVGAGFTEIARGYVTQIKNFPTYNNPTGGLIKVHVQGCTLSTLQLSLLDSNSYPVYDLRASGAVTNPDGTYDMYWSLGARNLGYASLYAWAGGSCYATVYQSDSGFTPPPPPPPASCASQYSDVACRSTPGCVPQYQTVLVPAYPVGYYVNQFVSCATAFGPR